MIYRIDTGIVKLNPTGTDVPHIEKVIGKEENREEVTVGFLSSLFFLLEI